MSGLSWSVGNFLECRDIFECQECLRVLGMSWSVGNVLGCILIADRTYLGHTGTGRMSWFWLFWVIFGAELQDNTNS